MGRAEELRKKFGPNMKESVGQRPEQPAGAAGPAPIVRPNEGYTRDRDAGFVDIDLIMPDPNQPRKVVEEDEDLHHLADSFGDGRGILQPLVVRPFDAGLGKYRLMIGERRWRAAKLVGLDKVPVRILDRDPTPAEALADQLIENCVRKNLKPIDMAEGFRELMKQRKCSQEELSRAVFVSQPKISKALKLLELPADLREKVNAGEVGFADAYEAAQAEGEEAQRQLFTVKVNLGREKQKRGKRKLGKAAKKTDAPAEPRPAVVFRYDVPGGVRISVAFSRQPLHGEEILEALRAAVAQEEENVASKRRKLGAAA